MQCDKKYLTKFITGHLIWEKEKKKLWSFCFFMYQPHFLLLFINIIIYSSLSILQYIFTKTKSFNIWTKSDIENLVYIMFVLEYLIYGKNWFFFHWSSSNSSITIITYLLQIAIRKFKFCDYKSNYLKQIWKYESGQKKFQYLLDTNEFNFNEYF